MTTKIEIFGQNFAHFGRFEGSFLTILGVEKVQKTTFLTLKTAKMSQILTENFDFLGHLSTLRAENTTKSRPLKFENNA